MVSGSTLIDPLSNLEQFFGVSDSKSQANSNQSRMSFSRQSGLQLSKAERLGKQSQIDDIRRCIFSPMTKSALQTSPEGWRDPEACSPLKKSPLKLASRCNGGNIMMSTKKSKEDVGKSVVNNAPLIASRRSGRGLLFSNTITSAKSFSSPSSKCSNSRHSGNKLARAPYVPDPDGSEHHSTKRNLIIRRSFQRYYDGRELPVRVVPQSPFNRLGWIIGSTPDKASILPETPPKARNCFIDGSAVVESRELGSCGGLPKSFSELIFLFIQGISDSQEFPYRFVAIQGCSDLISYLPAECFTASFLYTIGRVFKDQIEKTKPVSVRGVALQLLLLLTSRMPFSKVPIDQVLCFMRTLLPQLGRSILDTHTVVWRPEANTSRVGRVAGGRRRRLVSDASSEKVAATSDSSGIQQCAAVNQAGQQMWGKRSDAAGIDSSTGRKNSGHHNQHQLDIVGTSVESAMVAKTWCPLSPARVSRFGGQSAPQRLRLKSNKAGTPKLSDGTGSGRRRGSLLAGHSKLRSESDATTIGSLASLFIDEVVARNSTGADALRQLIKSYIPAYQVASTRCN